MKKRKKVRNKNIIFKLKGFSLLEILILILIILILLTITVSNIKQTRNKAKIIKANYDIAEIFIAINALAQDTNEWPNHIPAKVNNTIKDKELCGDNCNFRLTSARAGLLLTDGIHTNWQGPYINSIRKDPWGSEYFFDPNYYVKINDHNLPCNLPQGWSQPTCESITVIGSYGPNKLGNNKYDKDDIFIKLPLN